MKHKCLNCGYIYDEEKEALSFGNLSKEWICPGCGSPKLEFEAIEEEEGLEEDDILEGYEYKDDDEDDEDDDDFDEEDY